MKRILLGIAAIFTLIVGVAAQDAAPTPAASTATVTPASTVTGSPAPGFSERHSRYQMQPSDTFDISFEYTPELNQTVTIQPDGFITLRSVGDVNVRDLTVPQATEKITQAYSKILTKPNVTILLKDFQKPYFIADGQVRSPGKYELRGDTTLVQALAMAGGFQSVYAKHSQVILFRRVDNNWAQARVIDVKHMQATHDLSEDVMLRPGDLLFVPKNAMSKVQQWMPIYSVNAMGAQTKAF